MIGTFVLCGSSHLRKEDKCTGIQVSTLYALFWFKTLTKGAEYTVRHLLAVKLGTYDSTYFIDTTAIMCCPPANSSHQVRNVAVPLQLWRSIFNDMHYI
jgi:hypothetical protein